MRWRCSVHLTHCIKKIIIDKKALSGPFELRQVELECGDDDTIAMIAYVYARKGVEKDGTGKPKIRLVYVGDRILNLKTREPTKILWVQFSDLQKDSYWAKMTPFSTP